MSRVRHTLARLGRAASVSSTMAAMLGPIGCLERREPDGVEPRAECTTCHGGVLPAPFEAAPPTSLAGDAQPSARGVGAHEAHLLGSDWARTIACTDCHVVPTAVDEA